MARAPDIKGVLIEGTDFSGKSTTARIVAAKLGDAILRRCFVTEHPLVMFIDREAKRYDDIETRDKFYTAALLMDLSLMQTHLPGNFIVQDRHWFSQVGRNLFFHRQNPALPVDEIVERHIPFQFNFYLISDLPSKKIRSSSRTSNSPRDSFLVANPDAHQQFDEFHLTLLPAHENWQILDNSNMSAEETAHVILSCIEGAHSRHAVG